MTPAAISSPEREWVVALPWKMPPLTLNQRMHWAKKAAITAQVRHTTALLVKAAKVPALSRCGVGLHYVPRDNRRRDADNLVASLKIMCDGVVDAGVVPDDQPAFMHTTMPTIHQAQPDASHRLWLLIIALEIS